MKNGFRKKERGKHGGAETFLFHKKRNHERGTKPTDLVLCPP